MFFSVVFQKFHFKPGPKLRCTKPDCQRMFSVVFQCTTLYLIKQLIERALWWNVPFDFVQEKVYQHKTKTKFFDGVSNNCHTERKT